MGVGVGAASYVAFGMQTAFRTVQTTLITAAHLRTGSVFTSRQTQTPRETTTAVMPRADQTWSRMGLVDVDAQFEYVANDTAFLPLMTSVWGKRIKTGAVAPFTHTYVMLNPFVDGGTDAGGTFYNHSLTMREVVSDGAAGIFPTVVQDITINRFQMTMAADDRVKFQVTGVGQKRLSTSAPSFTDISGTTLAWQHAYTGANGGLYVGVANPPTTALVAKSVTFELDNNLSYEPSLGSASGEELFLPQRAGFPTAKFSFEMWYEDATTGTDAVSLLTDFLAGTKENCRIEYYVDANNSLELLLGKTADSGVIDDPKPVYSGPGVVGFTFNLLAYPITQGATATDDLQMVQTTAT